MAKAKDEKIPDIGTSWEGYAGKRVEEFIKGQIKDSVNSLQAISPKETRHFSIVKANDYITSSAYGSAIVEVSPPLPAGRSISIVPDNSDFTLIGYSIIETSGKEHTLNKDSANIPFGENLTFEYDIAKIHVKSYASQKFNLHVDYDNEVYTLPDKVDEIDGRVGELANLATGDKTSIVGAINSVNGLLDKTEKSAVLMDNVAGIAFNTPVITPCYIPIGGHFKFTVGGRKYPDETETRFISIVIANETEAKEVYYAQSATERGSLEFDTTMRVTEIRFSSYYFNTLSCEVNYNMLSLDDKIAENQNKIGDISALNTDDKSNLTNAINSVNGLLDKSSKVFEAHIVGKTYNNAAYADCYIPIGGHFKLSVNHPEGASKYIVVKAGTPDNMKVVYTTGSVGEYGSLEFDTSMRVTRIELFSYNYSSIDVHVEYNMLTMDDRIEENKKNIGNLDDLNTDDKNSLVSAANSIVRLLPDMEEITEYDVVRGSGNGVGTSNNYDCQIRKGSMVTIHPYGDPNTTNYGYYIIIASNDEGESQVLLQIIAGTWTGDGRWDTPVEIKINATKINITSYAKTYVDIYHTRRALAVETQVKSKVTNRWYGKKWLLIGDSISTEREHFVDIGYGQLVAKSLGLNLTNIAVSGKTMSWGYDIIDSQPDDFDLITVMLGTNNQGYNTTLGSLNDSYYEAGAYDTNLSFYAATQLFYEKLRTKFPKSIIVFITPIKRRNNEGTGGGDDEVGGDQLGTQGGYNVNALGLTTEAYRDVIIDVCKWYSVPCIDIFNTIDPRTEWNRKTFFMDSVNGNDGTHPNELGHALFIAPVVEDGLLRVAPYWFNDWSQE